MNNNHPITPPPELVEQWADLLSQRSDSYVFTKAARWGADQELEACINFVYDNELCDPDFYNNLRNARRPKSPTLNSIALQMLGTIERDAHYLPEITDAIRRALEALPDA